ncbi:helix-turn-helix transcriptional regulator [Streptomyces sp. H10-C2]|uniref:helix-turn-helix transcriptional regulator n=1 Tax=unclassified Streptomyces TaxID=2593676 RepID=UPI0024B9868A|nr:MULTISPECIES: helix-turn-helix transcriptional regulator [unclassified Streptomyces]MDJ0342821.1 helix-turn-helix transcriptional regulator [Streptomyces sp. PH10-H1]MDJ0372499.1 helix-turn-helix transcriptional regulator [Streptomyces sp. H10-C2]
MPARQFNGELLRQERRAREWHQADVARAVGVERAMVAQWEAGTRFASAEKLATIAAAFSRPLDEMFPRKGPADLKDLRTDAGFSQIDAAKISGVPRGVLSGAELGHKPLDARVITKVAEAYNVTEQQVRAAQSVSFGDIAPTPAVPQTLSEKVTYLLNHTYPGAPPSDREFADQINARAGRQLVTAQQFAAVRTGRQQLAQVLAGAPDEAAFYESLAEVLGVSPVYFQSGEKVAQQVVESIKLLAAASGGLALAARGAEQAGLAPEMIAKLVALIEAERDSSPPASGQ